MKLAFREDEPAGVVRCFVSKLDDSERIEIATMSLALLSHAPDQFRAWAAVMESLFAAWLEHATGEKVAAFHHFKPHDKN